MITNAIERIIAEIKQLQMELRRQDKDKYDIPWFDATLDAAIAVLKILI